MCAQDLCFMAQQYLFDFFSYNEAKVFIWLQTPNEYVGSLSPNEMIASGHSNRLYKIIVDLAEENGFYET